MPSLPPQLVRAIAERRAIFFLGAGVSQAAGLSGSKALVSMLRDELLADLRRDPQRSAQVKEAESVTNLSRIAQLYEDYYRSSRAHHKVSERILDEQRRADASVLFPLRDLPTIREIITTNYDELVEGVLSPTDYYTVYRDADLRQQEGDRLRLVKLHGTARDRDSLVLTDDDYKNFRRDRAALSDFTKNAIRMKTLVVIGYSLEDRNFEDLYTEASPTDVLNYFVSPDASLYQELHWVRQGFEHISMDAGAFLTCAAEAYASEAYAPAKASFTEKLNVSVGAVDPLNNPFTLFDTEALIDTRPRFLFDTFVKPVEFPTILEHQHTFIEGHRGSGKSTILWRLSLRARKYEGIDLPMWGFYVKMVPGLFFAFRRPREATGAFVDDDQMWVKQFTHYFNLIIFNGALLNLASAVEDNVFAPPIGLHGVLAEITSELLRIDAPHIQTLRQLCRFVERQLDTARSGRASLPYYTGPTFLSQALEVLSDAIPELREKWWHILIDEYDNVYPEQQAVVNFLLRERHPRLRYKLAVKTLHTYLKDIDGKTLDPTDDFGYVACDSFIWEPGLKARYIEFLRELSQQRLSQAGVGTLSIEELFPAEADARDESYAGFQTYAVLSSGLTRLYLELCKDAIYEAFPDTAVRRIELKPVPVRTQIHVARVHSAILYKSYASAREPEALLKLFRVIGPLFRGIAKVTSEQNEYRSPLSFELSDLDELSAESLGNLEDAVKARLLQLPILPKQPHNPLKETPAQKYSLHRLLCPFFRLSINERYTVKIEAKAFNQIWSHPDMVRDQLASNYKQKGISRHIEEMLPLFPKQ